MTSSAVNLIPAKNLHPPRTRYRKGVKPPSLQMLKRGKQNAKLGDIVSVKKWKNHVMYSLTLEERKTCPSDCDQWDNCYGNNMPFAHRFDHTGPLFLENLGTQLARLVHKHRKKQQGVVVRLHVLGDFFSDEYVEFWHIMLDLLPDLKVFGYTHHKSKRGLGKYINASLNNSYPDRAAIRFSDDMDTPFRATVNTGGGIVCPEQTGATASCTTCGYCWSSSDPVVFLEH